MGRLPIATAALSIALVATGTGEQSVVATGAIAGKVKLTKRVRGAALASNVYPSRAIGHQDLKPPAEIKNVVVYLKDPPFHGELPVMTAELRQQNETFVPHVLAITRGSSVDFPNEDPFFHNVFSLSGAATFDLGRFRQGQARTYAFNRAGLVKVYCHIHSQMNAAILVLDHPYFAIPGDDGGFELKNVPPGDYSIVGWHERIGEHVGRIRVRAGEVATIDLALPVEDTP